ncbi:MAG: tetratricopeptide repeat protein, partial [Saprospiraceae bacterium]|nr:tetratricopeptide repeat protein [Saprospiraceae bacterium]
MYVLADTAVANALLKEARVTHPRRADSALLKADKALLIFEQVTGKESRGVAEVLNTKANLYRMKQQYDKALDFAQKSLNLCIKLYGEQNADVNKAYIHLGRICIELRKPDTAKLYFQKAIPPTIIPDTLVGSSHLEIGRLYDNNEYYEEATGHYQKTIDICRNASAENTLMSAQAYFFLGALFKTQGKFEESRRYIEKALQIRLAVLGKENHPLIANTYMHLAETYRLLFDIDKALYYGNKFLDIAKLQPERYRIGNLTQAYRTLGEIYVTMDEYDKAIDMFYQWYNVHNDIGALRFLAMAHFYKQDYDKALYFIHRVWDAGDDRSPGVGEELARNYIAKGENEKAIRYALESLEWTKKVNIFRWHMESYFILGDSYNKIGIYDKAVEAYRMALKIYEDNIPTQFEYKAYVYKVLSNCYEKSNQLDSAYHYYQNTLSLFKKLYGNTHPDVIEPLLGLARIAEKKKDYQGANTIYNQILKEQNFEVKKVRYDGYLFDALTAKATFERQWYLASGNKIHLIASAETYRQALTALDYQNRLFSTEGSKADQKKKRYTLYEGAIETNRLLNNPINTFTFMEESKANLLQSKLKEDNALRFANIPDNLLQREKELRLTITMLEKGRQERLHEGKPETDSLNLILAIRADSIRTLYADLKKTFEQNYPDYYRLKYSNKTIDVTEVQQKLLSKEQTLLSYFVGDSSIYAFVVRPDTFAVFDFKKDFPLESWVQQLRDGLYGYHTATIKTEKLYDMKADSFTNASFQLQQKLIAPLSNLLTREVVIVPDGVLGYVPFDVLLTEQPKDALKF